MGKRVLASTKARKQIEELMRGRAALADAMSEIAPLATRLLLEEGAEAEARGAVGRQ